MTYGLDQCRRCGTKIEPYNRRSMEFYLDSLKKPTMPEKEWRAMGLLAMPTKAQILNPADGCCWDCGQILMKRRAKPALRGAIWVSMLVGFSAFVVYVYIFMRH